MADGLAPPESATSGAGGVGRYRWGICALLFTLGPAARQVVVLNRHFGFDASIVAVGRDVALEVEKARAGGAGMER